MASERKRDILGLGIAIFNFSLEVEHFFHDLEVEHFFHDYSRGSLRTLNEVKLFFMALNNLLGALKIGLFLHFQGVYKKYFFHPRLKKNHFAHPTGSLDSIYGVKTYF